jgi:hypothetical protein
MPKAPENVAFSKKTGTGGGGSGKPAPRPEPPRTSTTQKNPAPKTETSKVVENRVTLGWKEKDAPISTNLKPATTQGEAKIVAKDWLNGNKQSMGNNKWVDKKYIYQIDDAKHHGNMVEIEVFSNSGEKPHKCVLDCFGRKIKPAKNGRIYNGK